MGWQKKFSRVKNGTLSSVVDKNTIYGFHTVNKETYEYNNGKFAGFSSYKLSLRGGEETRKEYKMSNGVLVRTKNETKISETY